MSKKRGLGKSLDALLGDSLAMEKNIEPPIWHESSTSDNTVGNLRTLPVEILKSGKYQPRKDMQVEALKELSASIKSQGIMQPILVRRIAGGEYEIIAGERRWRAAQMAELDEVPVIIRDVPDEAALAMSLIENIQRENLNPIEEASALQRLQDEFVMTHQEVADAVGKSRATVTNLLRLLSLEGDVRTMLESGDLEMGHSRALLVLDKQKQLEVAHTVASKNLSVRETEALVRKILVSSGKSKSKRPADPDVLRLENRLADSIGAKVQLQHSSKGKGKLVIHYDSLDQLDGILEKIDNSEKGN